MTAPDEVVRLIALEQREIERFTLTDTRRLTDLFERIGLLRSPQEEFWVVAYDTALNVRTAARVSMGDYHETAVPLPALFAVVLSSGARRFLVAHNHPGDSAQPSDGDMLVTRRLRVASALLGLEFEDHLIVPARGEIFSFAEAGVLFAAENDDEELDWDDLDAFDEGVPPLGQWTARDLVEAARRDIVQWEKTRSIDLVASRADDGPVRDGELIEIAYRDQFGSVHTGKVVALPGGEHEWRHEMNVGSDGMWGPWPVAPTEAGRSVFLRRAYQSAYLVGLVQDWLDERFKEAVDLIWTPTASQVDRRQHLAIVYRAKGVREEGLVDAWWVGETEGFKWQITHTWQSGQVGGWPLNVEQDVIPQLATSAD
jgi:DNA repair protein RadC